MIRKVVHDLQEENKRRLKTTFLALKFRNYRLWFFGQLFSLFGMWMEITASGFLIYELTGSAAYLGMVAFAAGLPAWLFTLYGGVISDRYDRRKILTITQSSMMVLSFILAYLTFSGLIRPWHLLVLSFLGGIANAFDAPARQAFILDLVDREHMTNAIAMNSMMFNTSVIVGPAIGGLIYAAFGPSWCFMINGISFLAIIVSLGMMKTVFTPKPIVRKETLNDLRKGLSYASKNKVILGILIFMMTFGLFASSIGTLVPAWAVQILHGDSRTSGFMIAFRGIGALAMALFIASMGNPRRKGKLFTIGTFMFPAMIGVMAFLTDDFLTFAILILIGASNIMITNVSNMIVQIEVSDEYRGRVMSIMSLVFFGFMPLGSLLIGWLATGFGEQIAVLIVSGMSIVSAFTIWRVFPSISAVD